jgi:UDPglucose 6-dehydrogenase
MAAREAHAVVVLTEWEEFGDLDLPRLHRLMLKPAFVFDGRGVLPVTHLKAYGFKPYVIGKVS